MSVRIRIINLEANEPRQLHYFANFAEEVWRKYCDDRRVEVDLNAVDNGSSVLIVTTRGSLKGRIIAEIAKLIERSGLKDTILVESA
ncbi:MAG: hypothetical protein ACRCSU_00535 [Paracoccaceae bacterium]